MTATSSSHVCESQKNFTTGQGHATVDVENSCDSSSEADLCSPSKRVRNDEHVQQSLAKQAANVATSHSKEMSTDADQNTKGKSSSTEGTGSLMNLQPSEIERKEETALRPTTGLVGFIEAEAAEDKGSRHMMEDAWVVLPDAHMGEPGKLRFAHFAIYDGHGGRHAAEFARAHLHANVVSSGLPRELMDVKVAKKAIIEGFKRTDEALLRESTEAGWLDGATGVSVWILGKTVFVANIGDAKAVLARETTNTESSITTLKGITVTREHKAIFPSERARIEKAGGYVGKTGRLMDRLEVSRAFGDRQFKKVGVSAIPEVHSFELTEREQFLILGCDGLWGVFGPSDAVVFVEKQLKEGVSTAAACRRLVREAVRERGCKDNCTAVLIVFRHSGGTAD